MSEIRKQTFPTKAIGHPYRSALSPSPVTKNTNHNSKRDVKQVTARYMVATPTTTKLNSIPSSRAIFREATGVRAYLLGDA